MAVWWKLTPRANPLLHSGVLSFSGRWGGEGGPRRGAKSCGEPQKSPENFEEMQSCEKLPRALELSLIHI
eukprot:7704370-Alexandrium_andersonii.AAC.1